MASQIVSNDTRTQLEDLLKQWGARWRFRQVMLYTPRILIATFIVGIVVSLIVALLRLLPMVEMLILTGIAMGATFTIVAGAVGLFGKAGAEAARQFDELFELQERISTALEILDGRIQTSPQLAERQLEDTYNRAQNIDPKKQIPLTLDRMAWGIAIFMVIPFLVVVIFASIMTLNLGNGGLGAATQQAIADAADTTRDVTTEIATDTALTEEERTALLESSEQTLAELENPETTAEDAFVAMEELEADLREQASAIREEALASQTSLQEASDALNNQTGEQTGSGANQLSQQLSDTSETVEAMNEQELAELQERLENADEAAEEENPQLSEALATAAQAIEMGDIAGAQDALDSASQQASEALQQNQNRQEAAEALEQQAENANASAGDIAASEFNENAQTEGQIDNTAQGLEEAGAIVSQMEMEEQAPGAGLPDQNQPSTQGETGRAVESNNPDAQTGETAGQSESENNNSDNQGASEEAGEGAGAGQGDSPEQTQDITGGGDTPAGDADSSNSDGGEEDYEALFAPETIDVPQGNQNVELDAEGSNTASVEGDFDDNPTGTSRVPYNQIFSSYADAANSALENGYVPLGVRDVVRDYFTSIEPTGNQSQSDE